MRKSLTIFLIVFSSLTLYAQEENPVQPGSKLEQQLENLTELQDSETEDDSYLQSLVQFRRHPLNLNTATASELRELRFLNALQIQSLLRYRLLLGNLINIYELQAVPGFDVETIQRIIGFVTVGNPLPFSADMKARFTEGQHSILIRGQQVLEKSNGFIRPDSIANRYPGSAQRLFVRYKYVYRNLFQFGIVGDKDAGEQFFKGQQKSGFDFYSFHLFARKLGPVKLLALGDFTVNMGQGLIHWQSLAFKKSADVVAVKRQADILRPYNSAGEYNFQRGIGATVGVTKKIDVTAFASYRNLDASLNGDTSQTNEDFISSILNSGYHRTPNEQGKKNLITQTSFGGNISYNSNNFHLGANGVGFMFSSPLQKDIQPYNQYSIQGKSWHNYSLDYSYTYRNIHLFGEAAMDKNGSKALVSGLLASLDPRVDASLVYRNIEKTYQTLYGNAFTESTFPTNEKGLFAGLSIKPIPVIRIDAYADIFSFTWLKFRVDAPSQGTEYFIQLNYKPNKQVELYTRYRNENKPINLSGLDLATRSVFIRPRQDWRTQVSYKVSRTVTLRNRVQLLWYNPKEKDRSQEGFVSYVDFAYKPLSKPLSLNTRLQYFETEGFDSRIYVYESDVLYSFSIPQFIGKGLRYYVNLNYDVTKKMTVWFRWAQTIYQNHSSIGSGLDEIKGNKRSEVKLQMMYNF
ncbi:MAG: hypothetical protein JWQ96_1495 [Segetibacter sp.]|nr:hypothetical protein [Segetibacter sp.]